MPPIPPTAMTSVSVTGPFWSAEIQVIQLADPCTNWAFRSLFLDLQPRSRLGQEGLLLPGTMIVLGWAQQVTVEPSPGVTYTWSQPVTVPSALPPEGLRHHLNNGELCLLLVQADPEAWPERFPSSSEETFFPPLTCLNGTIPLDRLATSAADAERATQDLYQALGLALPRATAWQQRRDRVEAGEGAARLLSLVSVHSSGLSLYGPVNLPWQSQALAAPLQVAQTFPNRQQFRVSLELDRLTQGEAAALQAAWAQLGQMLNPLTPLNPAPGELAPTVPNWVTLDVTNPQGVPPLFWEITAWGEAPILHLPADELSLTLSDQPPGSQTQPPTSLAKITPRTVWVQPVASPTAPDGTVELFLTTSADATAIAPDPEAAALTYEGVSPSPSQPWQETIHLTNLTTAFDPVGVPRFLRSRQQQPRPLWSGEVATPLSEPLLWGFMPLENGWAQLPILNLTEQIYLDSRVARPPQTTAGVTTTASGLFQGAVSLGNQQPTLRPAHRHEQPWNLVLTNGQALSGSWILQAVEPEDPDANSALPWRLSQIQLTLAQPQLTLNGLFWLSTGQPRIEDALPDLDDWVDGVRPQALTTVNAATDVFPPPLVCTFDRLTLTCHHTPAQPASARLGRWQFTYGVNPVPQAWLADDTSETAPDVSAPTPPLQRLITAGVLPTDLFQAYLPLVWQRHNALPMVQALPLTQSQSPPNYPSASRQLMPYELPVSDQGLPQGWIFGVNGDSDDTGAATWPQALTPLFPAQEWRTLADLPWVSLSLAGLMLRPQADVAALAADYRHDLPYTDEVQALAQLPEVIPDPDALSPLPAGEPPQPPPPLTRETLATHWQTLSTLASLAQADGTLAFRVEAGTREVMDLIHPYSWPVEVAVDLDTYPGQLTLTSDHPLQLTGEAALEGISGQFQLVNGSLQRRPDGLSPDRLSPDRLPPYTLVAGSLAAHPEEGGLRDQRGWTRSATTQTGPLVRSPLTLQRDRSTTVAYTLTSLQRPMALQVGHHSWQFWFRDLPCQADGQQFRRHETLSPLVTRLNSDVNDPEARSQFYNALNGYEWRLGESAPPEKPSETPPEQLPAYLELLGLHFYPLTLEAVDIEGDTVTTVEMVGRLQLPLVPATGELKEVSNAVRLRFSSGQTEAPLILAHIQLESTVAEWPLATTQGELDNAPMLSWATMGLAYQDGEPVIQLGDADAGESGQVWLRFVLFDQIWSVPFAPFQLPAAPDSTLTYAFPAPTAFTHLAPLQVALALDLNDLNHQASLLLEVQIGRGHSTGNQQQSAFLAQVRFDLLQHTQTWETADFFFGDLQGRETAEVTFWPGTLQFQWQGYQAQSQQYQAADLQLLPGLHLQGSNQVPGFVALTFTPSVTTPATADSRLQLVTLELDTAFMEMLLFCQWGEGLQQGSQAEADRHQVYRSSAGDLAVGYTAHWDVSPPEPDDAVPPWRESLLINGFLEVHNLLSWPLAMAVDTNSDQTTLTLPAARAEGQLQPLNHLRHTARILFNQHVLEAELLQPGPEELLFDFAPDRLWQFLAVVEHQLITVLPQSLDLSHHHLRDDRRWTVTQTVRLGLPAQLKQFALAQRPHRTVDPAQGVQPLEQALGGSSAKDLWEVLATADNPALDQLMAKTLLVDLSSPHWIRQVPISTGATTTLQFLPNGVQLGIPSNPEDYVGSDPHAPLWLLLALPFVGRLQHQGRDLPSESDIPPNGLQVDPIVAIAAQPPEDSLSLAHLLAAWGNTQPLTRVVSSFDTALGRTWSRLDPLSLEESWFRLQHPQPEPSLEGLQSVMATRPDTPARLSRATALQQAFNPHRQSYPPQPSIDLPLAQPRSLLVVPNLEERENGLQVLYQFQPNADQTLVQDQSGLSPALDLTIRDPNHVEWSSSGLRLTRPTLIESDHFPQRLVDACRRTNEITLEAWIFLTEGQVRQSGQGPKRIVTLSIHETSRYITLGHSNGQKGGVINGRLRTTQTNANGMNPDVTTADRSLEPGLSHIVYTRNQQGAVRIYINGVERGRGTVGGNLFAPTASRESDFRLALGDEINRSRAWLGEYRQVAIYDRAWSAQEVEQRHHAGVQRRSPQRQAYPPWQMTGLHLRTSQLWAVAPEAPQINRYAAATQLSVLPPDQAQPHPLPVSLAVSPYLGLEFRPAQGDYTQQLVSTELLCLNPAVRQLRPVASHLWEDAASQASADSPMSLPARILTWAQQTHLRLAPQSSVAILRYRQINRLTPTEPATEPAIESASEPVTAAISGAPPAAPLTTTYQFQVVPALTLPAQLTQRVFQLRSRVDQLRFRQGQFGGPPLADSLNAFEVAPPQVTGVQPFYLTQPPATDPLAPAPQAWPWGLSALRFSVTYTGGQDQHQDHNPQGIIGVTYTQDQHQQNITGQAHAPYRRWWQAPHYHVQFRSALAEDGPTAGLPPYFRAPAIKSLLPTCPNPLLPPATVDDVDWQPVLPGALRYFLTGDRAGVFLSLRHQLMNQLGSNHSLASGSVPVQHRVPRPVPLPPNTTPTTALRPWAHYFAPDQGQAIAPTPFDTAFFAEVLTEDNRLQPAQGLLITLVSPAGGEIDGEWTGEVHLQLQDLNPSDSPASWAVRLSLLGPEQPLVYSSDNGTYSLDTTRQATLQNLLRAKVPGDVLTLQAQVMPRGSSSGFYQTLSFPLRLTDFDRSPLPLEPYFIQFEDPEYNRQLASAAAHATQEVLIPAANDQSESASHSVQLSCDRTEYNPDSTLALRYDWDDDTERGQATLTIRRIRAGVATQLVPGASTEIQLNQLSPRQLIQIPLADLRLQSQPDQVAALTTGTVLEFQLTIQTKDEISVQPGDKPEDKTPKPPPDPVVLTVDIVEDPVTPATEAAYGLLRQRHPDQVACVRFAWGPMPQRIELIQPEDLRTEIVRRRAVFQWQDTVRPAAPGAEPVHYAIQKITQTGSTYSPPPPLVYDFTSL
ncbi:MAG: LamG domain-containing protein [Leptolyngbya sp. LCM1.Bin17]|nr:MAG: LamG domain-containing protein [Leptolyngbya sp. LCM1.Bin17]